LAEAGLEPPQKNPDFSGIFENHSAKYSALKDGGVTMPPELGEILEVWDSLSPQQKEAFRRFVNGQQGIGKTLGGSAERTARLRIG